MTRQMDRLFIRLGLDSDELAAISHRNLLYGAILVSSAMGLGFITLTIYSLFS